MSKISLKTDYVDGEVLYGAELNANNQVTINGVNDNFNRIVALDENKADQDYIDTQLAKKVDIIEYNSEIQALDANKATKAEVALKANQTEVDTKASLDYVNTQLATKANTASVNAQLATKANSTDVASALELKEDKATIGDLDDLTTEVKTSIVDAINSIGVVETPIATTSIAGKVKPDGETITVDQDGTIHAVGGGGTGGTTDYALLTNKPQINSVELSGNKSLSSLGLMSATDINTALNGKANASTTYSKTETDNAIAVAVADKADASDVATALSAKADVATTYNKTTVDELLAAQESTLNASIATKAPQATTYNKTEVDTAVAAKADGLSFSNNELQLKSGNTAIGSPVTLNIVGNEVEISTTQPTDPDNKLWINPNTVSNLGTEVVNAVTGNETTKSPSVRAIKTYVDSLVNGTILYDNSTGSNGSITLSDSAANYSRMKIFIKDNDNKLLPACEVENPNGKNVNITEVVTGNTSAVANMTVYMKTKQILINETSITNVGYTQLNIYTTQGTGSGAATTEIKIQNNIYITKVIGYK